MASEFPHLLDKPAKVRVELGSATGQVNNRAAYLTDGAKAELERGARHVLRGAVRPSVNMAVLAGLIAQLSRIDLKDIDSSSRQWAHSRLRQRVVEALDAALAAVEDSQLLLRRG